jgi:hypothetical protein
MRLVAWFSRPLGFVCLVLVALAAAQANAQVQGTLARPRVFIGDSDTCIFNDSGGTARNCFTGTVTFLSAPPPTEPGFFDSVQRLRSEDVTFTGAGLNLGGSTGGWTTQHGEYRLVTSYTRGITQNLNLVSHCRRIGDCANYFYIEHDGGVAATGDEAVEALGLQANETLKYYRGKLLSTSGPGDLRPRLSGGGDEWVTDGGMLLDITRGTLTGELAGTSSVLGNYLVQLRLAGAALPKSTAWGTVLSGYSKPASLANVSLPVTVEVTLGDLGGKPQPFTAAGVCVAGPGHFEQAVIEPPDPAHPLPPSRPGHQWMRVEVRYPNPAVTDNGKLFAPMFFQGGVCGQYVSADADLRFSGMRTTYPAFGSLDGSDLITGKEVAGVMKPYLPQEGSQAWALSGAQSRFHLYPGAEIVANDRLSPQLEPNGVAWQAGDLIESPHYMTVGQNVLFVIDQQGSPTDQSYGGSGMQLVLNGKGMAGQHKGIFLANVEANASYRPYGGPLVPPNATYFQGQFNDVEHVVHAPNHALTGITFCNIAGRFSLFDLPNLSTDHAAKIDYDCATGRVEVPRLSTAEALVSGSLKRGGSDVCTEDGAHCPTGPALSGSLPVGALARGTCATFTAELHGLRENMVLSASARGNPGLVTTSTYFAGQDRAGLVLCAPVEPSRATVYNLSAR